MSPQQRGIAAQACKFDCEGIVSKRLGSTYRSGRSRHRPCDARRKKIVGANALGGDTPNAVFATLNNSIQFFGDGPGSGRNGGRGISSSFAIGRRLLVLIARTMVPGAGIT
jgi:hypothetical protein